MRSLEEKIQQILGDPKVVDPSSPPIKYIALMHRNGSNMTEVATLPVGTRTAKDLADTLDGRAEDHASGLPDGGSGQEYFEIWPFTDLSSGKPVARISLTKRTIPAMSPTAPGSIMSEPPNDSGSLGQSMRHREDFHQMGMMMVGHAQKIQSQIISQQFARNQQLEHDNAQMFEFVREVMMKQIELSHEKVLAEESAKQRTKLLEAGVKHGPALLAVLFGKPVGGLADKGLVDELFDSLVQLSPKEAETLIEIMMPKLSPALATVFMAKWNEHQERANKKPPESK